MSKATRSAKINAEYREKEQGMITETAPVYVIGHKNPDTDSICSAIAYAELKNRLHGGGYCAARAGQINQETQYVLNFFQASAPKYVEDVTSVLSGRAAGAEPSLPPQLGIYLSF